ncbi:MAG: UMP kinase, partial [Micrococcales bacterium]|nr:UMP kinase [Micrococcales bacterium]
MPSTPRRVLLKLSGEAFGGGNLGVNPDIVSGIAKEIAEAAKKVEIAVVV